MNMKQINYTATFWMLTIMALAGGIMLASQSQDMRRGAAFSTANLSLLPNDEINAVKGGDVNVKLNYTNSNNVGVDAIRTQICFKRNVLGFANSDPTKSVSVDSAFETVIGLLKTSGENDCLDLTLIDKEKSTKAGTFQAASITFKALAAGSGSITIDQSKSEISGENSSNINDSAIAVGTVGNTSYKIVDNNGNYPVLNFKVAFSGIKAGASCAASVPVQVIAVSQGSKTKTYTATANRDGSNTNSSGDAIFKVENLVLSDMQHTNKLSIFVKGSKHAQMKYGKDGQNNNFTQNDGEITVTKESSSPVLNFAEYPILAGDVTGPTSGSQDGWIRANDFTYIKEKSLAHTSVNAGENIDADLNGDCQVNTGDLQIFKNSLIEKQDQLY